MRNGGVQDIPEGGSPPSPQMVIISSGRSAKKAAYDVLSALDGPFFTAHSSANQDAVALVQGRVVVGRGLPS